MEFVDEFARPPPPHRHEHRKVMILEEKDVDAAFFVQHTHLSYYFRRLAGAHYYSRSCAIEGMDGTETTRARASATGQDRHDISSQHGLRLVLALRIRQLVEVLNQGARRRHNQFLITAIHYSINVMPVLSGTNRIREFEQCHLAFEPDNAVQFRDQFESLFITQAGKVTAHREVTINSISPHDIEQRSVVSDKKLENQRETYHERVDLLRNSQDLFRRLFDVYDPHGITMRAQHRGKIAQTKVSLVLKTDEHNRTRRVACALAGFRTLEDA